MAKGFCFKSFLLILILIPSISFSQGHYRNSLGGRCYKPPPFGGGANGSNPCASSTPSVKPFTFGGSGNSMGNITGINAEPNGAPDPNIVSPFAREGVSRGGIAVPNPNDESAFKRADSDTSNFLKNGGSFGCGNRCNNSISGAVKEPATPAEVVTAVPTLATAVPTVATAAPTAVASTPPVTTPSTPVTTPSTGSGGGGEEPANECVKIEDKTIPKCEGRKIAKYGCSTSVDRGTNFCHTDCKYRCESTGPFELH
jgi:hypothetical protein